MNMFNICCICLIPLLINQGITAYGDGWEGSSIFPDRAIIERIEHPDRQQCLDEIENKLWLGACGEDAIDLSSLGLGSLIPMEIALRRTDCGLLGALRAHGVSLTGDQIVAHCVNGKHGINMPLLIKLVAATAPLEMQSQIRATLRQHPQVLVARK